MHTSNKIESSLFFCFSISFYGAELMIKFYQDVFLFLLDSLAGGDFVKLFLSFALAARISKNGAAK